MPIPPADNSSDSGILRASRRSGRDDQLRTLIDEMPVSIAMFDREMRYVAASQRWLRDYRIDREVVGLSHYDLFPEIPVRWRDVHSRCLAGESLSADGEEFVRKDGSVQWVKWDCLPWYTPQGEIGGLIIASEEITAQKEAELALKQLNATLERNAQVLHDRDERIRAILNTATDAIITINQRGLIEHVSPATERLFGYAPEELVGQNVKQLMPPPFCDAHDAYIARYLETREPRIIGTGREVLGRRKDGSIFPVSLAVSEVDHLNLFTGFIRDLTHLRELQRRMVATAEEERQRIGLELHDGIAQELTASSLYVRGLLNRLARLRQGPALTSGGIADPQSSLAEIEQIVQTLGQRLNETHQHVRELSHGMMPLHLDAEGLRAALKDLATSVSVSDDIACSFEEPNPVLDLSDTTSTHLFRVAQEVVNNAVRHSRATRIVIRLESFEGHVLLEIRDNGVGIDPAHRPSGPSEGTGWRSMHYRASLIGSHLQIESPREGGTVVRCISIKQPTGS